MEKNDLLGIVKSNRKALPGDKTILIMKQKICLAGV